MLKQGKTWFTLEHNDRNPNITNDCAIFSLYFRTMARSLNSRCGFKQGFFTCDVPVDIVEQENIDLGRDGQTMIAPDIH